MTIFCAGGGDLDDFVEVSEYLFISAAAFVCLECRQEIPAFVPFYRVRNWRSAWDEDWDNGLPEDEEEVTISNKPCCEACGDLAISFLELGYCWEYGQLRNDAREASGF